MNNLEKTLKIIAQYRVQKLYIMDKNVAYCKKTEQKLVQNLYNSLERYVTSLYETSPQSNDTHFVPFCQHYLLQNATSLVQNGWNERCHQICDDTLESDMELLEPVIV